MSSHDLDRLEDLFLEVSRLPPEERGPFLDERCAGEPELRERVEELLRVEDERLPSGTVSPGGVLFPRRAGDESDELGPETTVSGYRILEKIGEGGFGVVYRAEQQVPVRRQVALKLIKPGMDSKAVIARFEAERQALALMDHEHIARIFDGGMTSDDRPYFVMEYVPGIPITAYCDQERLRTNDRIRLVQQTCRGVQHAHQKGIIHRDLKPANVLVELRDGEPVVKIIDFGVAKAMGQQLTEHTLFTAQGQVIGSPDYMSPEQVTGSGLDIDTRADVYSLGVLLYEVLTGLRPFDLGTRGIAEIVYTIREKEPTKPSTRITTLGDDSVAAADKRRTDPRSLTRTLRADLDWITLKALEKDRNRRYATVVDLAEDLERHLTHVPVLAGPPGAVYRLRKFTRRNRALVVSVVAVIAVSLLAAVYSELQRRSAQESLEQARVLTDLFESLLKAPNPESGGQYDISLRETLDRNLPAALERLEPFPDLLPRFEHTVGTLYNDLGVWDKAEEYSRRAAQGYRERRGDDDPGTLAALHILGEVLFYTGRYEEAEAIHRDVFEARMRTLGERHRETIDVLFDCGADLKGQGRFDEAIEIYHRVIALRQDVGLPVAGVRYNLAVAFRDQGKLEEAAAILEERPDHLNSRSLLGVVYSDQRRFAAAEALMRDTLAARERSRGPEHPTTLRERNRLATVLLHLGHVEEASRMLRDVVAVQRRTLGDEHPDTLVALNDLALVIDKEGRQEEAIDILRDVVAVQARTIGPENPESLNVLNNLAANLYDVGELEESAEIFRGLVRAKSRVYGEDHAQANGARRSLATVLSALERSYEQRLEAAGPAASADREGLELADRLARLYLETQRAEEAIELLGGAPERALEVLPDGDPLTARIRVHYALAALELGSALEAEGHLLDGYAALDRALGPGHRDTREAVRGLAELYEVLGESAEVERYRALLASDE